MAKRAAGIMLALMLMTTMFTGLAETGGADIPPAAEATGEALPEPTPEPTAEPTPEPTAEPTAEPTPEPTAEPVAPPPGEPSSPLVCKAIEGGLQVVGCDASVRELAIPAALDGESILEIGKNAFEGCGDLARVVIAEGVLRIGKEAFKGCGALEMVALPSTLVEIADDAFAQCPLLTDMRAPDDSAAKLYADAWLAQNAAADGETPEESCEESPGDSPEEIPSDVNDPEGVADDLYNPEESSEESNEVNPEGAPDEAPVDLADAELLSVSASSDPAAPTGATDTRLIISGRSCVGSGKTMQLYAQVSSSTIESPTVLWSSSNADVATVTSDGLLRAKTVAAPVTVDITATVEEEPAITATIVVTVSPLLKSLSITAPSKVLTSGEDNAVTLVASYLPADAEVQLSWTSSDPGVVAVNDQGIAVGRRSGVATVTVQALDGSNRKASVKLTVVKPVESIALGYPAAVAVGKTVSPTIELAPYDASKSTLIWSVDRADLASVSSKGVVKGLKASGDPVTVTATCKEYGEVSQSFELYVKPAATAVSITADGGTIDLSQPVQDEQEHTLQLAVGVLPSAASQSVGWKTSNTKVANVDETGLVTAVGVGTAKLTATATDGSNKKATYTVKVVSTLKSIAIVGAQEIAPGKSAKLAITTDPASVANAKVTWASDNKAVATVSTSGTVKVQKTASVGDTVNITATSKVDPSIAATHAITVSRPLAEVTIITPVTDRIDISTDTTTMQLSAIDEEGEAAAVAWKSSNAKVATIDQSGLVTAVKPGSLTVTATALDGSGRKDTIRLMVVSSVTSVVTKDSSLIVGVGKSVSPEITVLPETASNKKLVWKSDNTNIATVSSKGAVKGIRPGATTVTAASQDRPDLSVTFSVTVKKAATKVVIEPENDFIPIGEGIEATGKLNVVVYPVREASQEVNWSTKTSGVATIDEDGNIAAQTPGVAKFTATTVDGSKRTASTSIGMR